MITEEQRQLLNDWFQYHQPSKEQAEALDRINAAALELAKIIIETTPQGADQSAALRRVREAKMTANAALLIPVRRSRG